jgi:putative MFS transporter
MAASVGRIGGIIGPLLTPVLVPLWGQAGVFAMFMVVLIIIALNVFVLGEETRGRSLEELGEARLVAVS